MKCLRAGCGGLLIRDPDQETGENNWKCAACSRRFWIAGELSLCKNQKCRNKTTGDYCPEHTIKGGQPVAPIPPPAREDAPPRKCRGPWSTEERAMRARKVEENRMKKRGVQEVEEVDEGEEQAAPTNPDGGFPPIQRPLPPAPDPPRTIATPKLEILEPFEVSFLIGTDAPSWLRFVARWNAAFPNHYFFSAYDSKDHKDKLVVNLRPKEEQ